ncbi:unnamed protein product [Miscanthus lutarioriparius]|uniref:Uncharacterized protein n=1 Tax=Miscanthus lutarioriparius TaxID=422564 RepID=A0A811QK96_9POAL|nr:unnamed protein product [Miscanthus lutarioriparius]
MVISTIAAFQGRFYFINSTRDMCAIDFTTSSSKEHPAFHYFDARKVDFPKGMNFEATWLLDCDDQLFLVDVSCVGVDPHNIGAIRVYKIGLLVVVDTQQASSSLAQGP